MKYLLALALIAPSITSCASLSASYDPPLSGVQSSADWSRTIDKPFDSVWESLVNHISGTFFGIDNFEKDSGLMTLSFGVSQIGEFVDGGYMKIKQTAGYNLLADKQVPAFRFEGNYADYLTLHHKATFTGKMNLFVRDIDGRSTEVRVRARYVVAAGNGAVWAFDTGGSATIAITNAVKGTSPTRTMRPTHKAEMAIIRAVEQIATK